jgi:2-phospho-L-lactate transferase/gluconeogenesis factor (CofD/UPF0052 family)
VETTVDRRKLMNITILSGGSGNTALLEGLSKKLKGNSCENLDIVINAYDSGKSTGICRKVTDTLGVSDIRKNLVKLYKYFSDTVDQNIIEFFEKRYDFTKGNEVNEIKEKLDNWKLSFYDEYVDYFFSLPKAKDFDYKDFNVANIVYAAMFKKYGYDKSIDMIRDTLNLKPSENKYTSQNVILNSFDNTYMKAITESGNTINDEGDIVEYQNEKDKIVALGYDTSNKTLNEKAIQAVQNTDLLIISSGTFWSSIYPTFDYCDFYKYINDSKAKKVWIMNDIEDKDSYGCGANYFMDVMEKRGLDLSDFTIIENLDAVESLKEEDPKNHNIVRSSMGNINGKHDPELVTESVMKAFFNLNEKYDYYLFDFDDTVWPRSVKSCPKKNDYCVQNVEGVNALRHSMIISGNTYESIKERLSYMYGSDFSKVFVPIWADANSIEYIKGEKKDVFSDFIISKNDMAEIRSKLDSLNMNYMEIGVDNNITNVKIKPLTETERKIFCDDLNSTFDHKGINCKAVATGKTTVDILTKNNSKRPILQKYFENSKVCYIGDEIDSGNDKEIAEACTNKIRVNSAELTNYVIELIRKSE